MSRPTSDLYEQLLAIKPPDLSESAWTKRAGVSRNFFQDVKSGRQPRIDNLEKVIEVTGITLAQFDAGRSPRAAPAPPGTAIKEAGLPFRPRELPRDVPVYGTAIGHDINRSNGGPVVSVETTLFEMGEVMDYVRRPPALIGRQDIYALYVAGNSMAPRYRPGSLVYVDPKRPPAIGDDVIVQLRAPDPEQGEIVVTALIKMLVRRSGSWVELEQFTPSGVFRVEISEISAIHRVMTLEDLMAV